MKTSYELHSNKISGSINISYLNGLLSSFNLELKQPLTDKQLEAISDRLSLANNETDLITAFSDIGLKPIAQDLLHLPANKKVAMFCEYYMKYHAGLKYKASRSDGSKIKEFKITDQILTAYFTSANFLFKGKHSIGNLVKYYNELMVEITSAGKPQHPDKYDKFYEGKLSEAERPGYWKHLRGLGLKPHKDRVGNTIDWI